MQRLLMVLRFQGVNFILGLITMALGIGGLVDYEPVPADSPFQHPIPYQLAFAVFALLGAVWAVRAWAKTPK